MRIGLFGGTFDPVHLGHLAMAEAAVEQAQLDQLWFIPAARSPHKERPHRFTADERWEFLRLAVQDNPRLAVSPWELHRPPPSYSIETVRHFAAEFPGAELFWLIGADQLPGLPRWRDIEELAQKVTFLCAPRNQGAVIFEPDLPGLSPFRLRPLAMTPHPASSTEVRHRFDLGEIPDNLLPTRVCQRLRSGPILPLSF